MTIFNILDQPHTTDEMLEWMQVHGSSVILNWAEDDNLWECSWITSGKRFTSWQDKPNKAILEAAIKARNYVQSHTVS